MPDVFSNCMLKESVHSILYLIVLIYLYTCCLGYKKQVMMNPALRSSYYNTTERIYYLMTL